MTDDTGKNGKFELNPAMLRELEAERQRALMVARAQARAIINLFEAELRAGESTFATAAMPVTETLEKTGKAQSPLLSAAFRFLMSGPSGVRTRERYLALIDQLAEHHRHMGQLPAKDEEGQNEDDLSD
jgi:hypothetical protein